MNGDDAVAGEEIAEVREVTQRAVPSGVDQREGEVTVVVHRYSEHRVDLVREAIPWSASPATRVESIAGRGPLGDGDGVVDVLLIAVVEVDHADGRMGASVLCRVEHECIDRPWVAVIVEVGELFVEHAGLVGTSFRRIPGFVVPVDVTVVCGFVDAHERTVGTPRSNGGRRELAARLELEGHAILARRQFVELVGTEGVRLLLADSRDRGTVPIEEFDADPFDAGLARSLTAVAVQVVEHHSSNDPGLCSGRRRSQAEGRSHRGDPEPTRELHRTPPHQTGSRVGGEGSPKRRDGASAPMVVRSRRRGCRKKS